MATEKYSKLTSQDKLPQWMLVILLLCFVIYCSKLLAELTWNVLTEDQALVGATSWVSDNRAPSSRSTVDSSILLTQSLFGKEDSSRPTQQLMKNVEAPKTKLQLQLKGVFTAEREEESSAIVAERGKKGEYFKIGDKLPGNAELVAVYSDRVLLKRNGRLETLSFEDTKKGGIAKVKPSFNRKQISSPEQFVDVAEKRLAESPATALASVGLRPVKEGSASGYVYDGNNPMLAGMNLKPGDVVRSVNGNPLGDINKDKALLKQLYQEGSLEVEVERDGTSFYINYPLR
ncbi:type II secretion system protein N [Alkalimarinus coralli]|uniref:type II secretion system protein N n=1 Tax=Alkalimarinus coralli TaxID=2935863 RepID=UPI00202AE816|nr:type II secretion system protein N [Alkalimarinus coralli]